MSEDVMSQPTAAKKRKEAPKRSAPLVWVQVGKTQHAASRLKVEGKKTLVRWSSTRREELVETSAVRVELSSRGRPRRRCSTAYRNRGSALVQKLRDCHDGMILLRIYSFLPLIDRFRLRYVDTAFRDCPQLFCQSDVGVYGHFDDLLPQAFAKMKEYLKFSWNPESFYPMRGVMHETPAIWGELQEWLDEGDWRERNRDQKIIAAHVYDFYDEDIDMYNHDALDDLEDSIDNHIEAGLELRYTPGPAFNGRDQLGRDSIALDLDLVRFIIESLRRVNEQIEETQEAIQNMETDIANENEAAPYNALYTLAKKHIPRFDASIFLKADYPVYDECVEYENNAHYLGAWQDTRGRVQEKYLEQLRPARKVFYKDINGAVQSGVIKRCDNCKKLNGDVKMEFCGRYHCFYRQSRCKRCSSKIPCSTCNRLVCVEDYCFLHRLEVCCVPGCRKLMCSPDDWDGDVWDGTGCVFMDFQRMFEYRNVRSSERYTFYYCQEHKPSNAVPVPPFSELLTGRYQERLRRQQG